MLNFACDNAQSTRELSAGSYKTEAALQALVIAAIYAAVADNAFTCSVDTSNYSAQDVGNLCKTLANANFQYSRADTDGDNLIITW